VDYFTQIIKKNSSRFTFNLDKRGRALISSDVRKNIGIGYNSPVLIRIGSEAFNVVLDERGRFVIPSKVRKLLNTNSGYVYRNGRDGVRANMVTCGVTVPSANLGRDPNSGGYEDVYYENQQS